MKWDDFAQQAPELAAVGRERMESTKVVMLGSIRKNGWPRVTPIEFSFFEGDLMIGGMWGSKKMLDLLRDSRCVLHTATTDPQATLADVKLYGHALNVDDQAQRDRSAQATFGEVGFLPEEPYHLFRIDITEVGLIQFKDEDNTIRNRLTNDTNITYTPKPTSPDYHDTFLAANWKAG